MWAYWDEYRYRTRFKETHEGYLDTPQETIEWLLMIDGMVAERERDEVEKSMRKSRG